MKSVLRIALIIQVLACVAILFNIPIARQVLGFIFLFVRSRFGDSKDFKTWTNKFC